MFCNTIPILITVISISSSSWLPKIIWTYWDAPIQQGSYLELYHLNRQKYTQGWDVRLLNYYTALEYLEKIPEFEGIPKNFIFAVKAHQADFLRVAIITHYGGVWMDYSTFLTQSFDWIQLQNLKNDPNVLNKYGNQPQVLLFTLSIFQMSQTYYDKIDNTTYIKFPGYQIWFLAAKPQTQFFKQLLKSMYDAYDNNGFNSFYLFHLKHSYVDEQAQQKGIIVNNQNNYLACNQLIQIIIQSKQKQLDLNQNLQENLAVQYYSIWHIKSQKGPYRHYIIGQLCDSQWIDIPVYLDNYYLSNYRGTARYFYKISRLQRQQLQEYFLFPNNFIEAIYYFIKYHKLNMIVKYFCPSSYPITQGSLVDKYLIAENRDNFPYIHFSNVLQQTNCPLYTKFQIICVLSFIIVFCWLFMQMSLKIFNIYSNNNKNEYKNIDISQEQAHNL